MSPNPVTRLSRCVDAIVRPAIFAPLLTVAGLLVSAWFVNHGLPVPDEGAVLTLAARVMRGQIFYRHLDAYYFPGAIYLLAGWMSIFGEHVNAARWLAAVVFSGLLLGLYPIVIMIGVMTGIVLFQVVLTVKYKNGGPND